MTICALADQTATKASCDSVYRLVLDQFVSCCAQSVALLLLWPALVHSSVCARTSASESRRSTRCKSVSTRRSAKIKHLFRSACATENRPWHRHLMSSNKHGGKCWLFFVETHRRIGAVPFAQLDLAISRTPASASLCCRSTRSPPRRRAARHSTRLPTRCARGGTCRRCALSPATRTSRSLCARSPTRSAASGPNTATARSACSSRSTVCRAQLCSLGGIWLRLSLSAGCV